MFLVNIMIQRISPFLMQISRPDEYDRLIKGGAKILFVGCPRVEGVLAMTRAIGFF